MTAQEAYKRFIVKINKNAQTNNISCDKGRFVTIYNESQNKTIEYILEKRNSDEIRYVQQLLVPQLLKNPKREETYELFDLPSNFLDHSTLLGKASKDCCKEELIDMYEIKSENENSVLFNEHTKPSFEWREAPYYLSNNKVKAFKSDFQYDSLHLTYYRYPVKISLKNPKNPESEFSDTEIELDEKLVDRIISRAASEFEANNNSQKSQADLQRAKLK